MAPLRRQRKAHLAKSTLCNRFWPTRGSKNKTSVGPVNTGSFSLHPPQDRQDFPAPEQGPLLFVRPAQTLRQGLRRDGQVNGQGALEHAPVLWPQQHPAAAADHLPALARLT